MVMNLRLSPEPVLRTYMGQLQEFTSLLLGNLEAYHNSLTYLFHFWSVLAQDLARSMGESLREVKEIMEKVVLQLAEQYIRQRLGFAEEFIQSVKDDVLCDMDSVYWEMKYIGLMLRFKLDLGSKLVADLYDALLREYNVALSLLFHCRTRAASPPRCASAAETTRKCSTKPSFWSVSLLPCPSTPGKLAWMIHFITHILAGQRFSVAQVDQGEEVIDADLCKRVFNLSHSIWYRMNMVPRFHCLGV